MNSLEVLLGDLRVGLLERFDDPYDTHRFTPDRQWLAMRARPVLGQIFEDWLPHPKELHGLIPWFDHLLPLEHRPQRKAIARDAGVEVDDSFALLAWLGDDLVGAVRLRVVESSPLQNRRTSRTIKAATEEAIYRASLPGAQWKLSLAERFNGLTLPLKGQAGEWIAKFHTDSFPAAVRREYATMAWARAAGLDVPEVRLVKADEIRGLPDDVPRGDGDVYLIRRFDRGAGGIRIHAEDFAQILDLTHGPGQFAGNYEDIARVLAVVATPDDVRAFVRQLVFCVLVGNGDAHAKNWSVIYPDGRRPRLSPAYDLVPTILVPEEPHKLALRLNGGREFARVSVTSFDAMARLVDVPGETMRAWVREDADKVRGVWALEEIRERFTERERARLERHMASVKFG